jgi:hypothetical protein
MLFRSLLIHHCRPRCAVLQGYYCAGQAAVKSPCKAQPGSYCPATVGLSISPQNGVPCEEGVYCTGGSADALPCAAPAGRCGNCGGSDLYGVVCFHFPKRFSTHPHMLLVLPRLGRLEADESTPSQQQQQASRVTPCMACMPDTVEPLTQCTAGVGGAVQILPTGIGVQGRDAVSCWFFL